MWFLANANRYHVTFVGHVGMSRWGVAICSLSKQSSISLHGRTPRGLGRRLALMVKLLVGVFLIALGENPPTSAHSAERKTGPGYHTTGLVSCLINQLRIVLYRIPCQHQQVRVFKKGASRHVG